MIENIWEGVYSTFDEVPASGEGFNRSRWAEQSLAKIRGILSETEKQKTIPTVVAYRASLLPILAAVVRNKLGKVRILDFGGGLGFTYIPVAYGMLEKQGIDFHIVDVESICKIGARVFESDNRIHFHASLPSHLHGVDILHIGSALQYVENWKGLIASLASYRPEFYIFTDLPAGDIPTYATAQLYYGSRIPYWFFNVNEVVDELSSAGYKLLFRSTYIAEILGGEQGLPQKNFPEDLQLGDACNLLFYKEAN